MSVLSFLSHILSAWFAFLLPCYGTFKALSHRPVSEPELERWSQYWAVIGVIVAFEYLGEFLISWLPFYWEMKTLFLLFLALPQTQGSTYIYTTYLQPFFIKNEVELDAGILSIQRKTLFFVQAQLASLWQIVWGILNKNAAAGQPPANTTGQAPAAGGGLTMESAMGLFRTYGPSLMSALQPAATSDTPPAAPSPVPSAATTSFQTAAAEHRTPITSEPDPATPPFPEPHLS